MQLSNKNRIESKQKCYPPFRHSANRKIQVNDLNIIICFFSVVSLLLQACVVAFPENELDRNSENLKSKSDSAFTDSSDTESVANSDTCDIEQGESCDDEVVPVDSSSNNEEPIDTDSNESVDTDSEETSEPPTSMQIFFSDFESDVTEFIHMPTQHLGAGDPWELGKALQGCKSGDKCWATTLLGNYSSCQSAMLVSPVIDLESYRDNGKTIELTFWHYYDFESTYDGGMVQFSNDAGMNWNSGGALTPNPAYDDVVNGGPDCFYYGSGAIEDHLAWTGEIPNAPGLWTKVTIPIENQYRTASFQVRFVVGTDFSENYYGWVIDDFGIAMY